MRRIRRVRELLLVIIGVITPVGVLAVNASAFIMQHLGEFRLTIAACALISALLLNGVSAYWAIRYAERNANPLFTEYRWWIVSLAVLAVLISAAVTTVLTYLGMRDPRHLPDLLSVLGSIAALAMPFALTYVQRRMGRQRARTRDAAAEDADQRLGRPPAAPAPAPATPPRSTQASTRPRMPRFGPPPSAPPPPPPRPRPRPFDADPGPPERHPDTPPDWPA